MDVAEVTDRLRNLLPEYMGFEMTRTDDNEIEARVVVRKEICTGGDIIHGGALMALADTVGAVGCMVNLKPGQGTTTLESKTNFFASAAIGETVVATSRPLHKGRRTHVWQTNIIRERDGRLLAQVTQTQMVLE
jgi:1,4-dihydroxy-2-naphthoyl-CoA hydrolase